jgi:hypothetical protein
MTTPPYINYTETIKNFVEYQKSIFVNRNKIKKYIKELEILAEQTNNVDERDEIIETLEKVENIREESYFSMKQSWHLVQTFIKKRMSEEDYNKAINEAEY